jgi:hypothetical protein
MLPDPFVPSAAGVIAACTAVVVSAPLFGAGLRALRRARALDHVRAVRLAGAEPGLVQVEGRVALESPLFAPISGQRCAGFRLVAEGLDVPVARSTDDVRAFRLVDGGVVAHVAAEKARWEMPCTAERVLDPDEPLTERLLDLLGRMPEAAWLRQSGRAIRLREHALLSGAVCHVTGQLQRTRSTEWRERIEYARTGTDDAPLAIGTLVAEAGDAPSLWIGPIEHADLMRVSGPGVGPTPSGVPPRAFAGLVAGPLLGLLGLLYLAAAADAWRALRGF